MQLIQLLEDLEEVQHEATSPESKVHRAVGDLDLSALLSLRDEAARLVAMLNDEALLRLELKGLRLPAHLACDVVDYRRACRWYVDAETRTLCYSPATAPFDDPEAWAYEDLAELEPRAAGPHEVFVTVGDSLTVMDGRYRCEPPSASPRRQRRGPPGAMP